LLTISQSSEQELLKLVDLLNHSKRKKTKNPQEIEGFFII